MKPKAAIFNLWPKRYPVIKAFADLNPDFLILVPYTGMLTVPMFNSFAGRIIPFDALLSPVEHASLASSASEMARHLGDFPSAAASRDEWQDFCGDAGVPPAATAETLFKNAGPGLMDQMVQVESLEKLLDRLDIRITVVTEEFTRLNKSLVVWAKYRSIAVLHINHSLGMGSWYTVHDTLVSDTLAVYGPIAVDAPMVTGLGGNRIFVSGNPDWIAYRGYEVLKPEFRREILARYFQGVDAPLVIFGTTYCAELTATEEGKDPSAQGRFFFRAIAALRRAGRRIHCLVKLRPNNDKAFEDDYAAIAAEEGLPPGDYLFVHHDVEKLMLAADVVVSVDSNLSVEALLADTVSINLITEWGSRQGPFYPPFTGILECLGEDLAGCIRDALENTDLKKRLAVMRRRSRTAYQSGEAGEGPALVLANLIGKMASARGFGNQPGPEVEPQPREIPNREEAAFPFKGAPGPDTMTVVIRPTGNLNQLKTLVDSLPGTCRPGFEVVCLVSPEQFASTRNALPEGTVFLQTGGSPHSRDVLGLLSSAIGERGGVVAFLDAHVRLPGDWDRLMSRHVSGKVAVGPLSDQMAGTQSIYHYLPLEKVDPGNVDSVSRNVRIRHPGMALSADWLYNHALVFGKDLLADISRLPDDPSDDNFLGLGRKLGLAGARLLVAKDVYVSMEP